MVERSTRAIVATEAIAALSRSGPAPLELLRAVAHRVRPLVPYAGAGWLLTDPATMLHTAAFPEDVPAGLHRRLIDNELVGEDVGTFARIARMARPAQRLSDATGGRLERSSRYRALYAPAGYEHEVRVAFRVDGACWAVACLARRAGEPPFSADEVAFLAGLSEPVAAGVRTGLRAAACADGAGGAGMVVVEDDGSPAAIAGEAERWLSELPRDGLAVPAVVYEVARRARAGAGPVPRVRVRGKSGRWLLVHGTALGDERSVVVLEPARTADLAPLVVRLHGLTAREQEVTGLLSRGLAIDEIARRLAISRHTVRDHVKAVFAKLGVKSRPELTAKLFYEHVLP